MSIARACASLALLAPVEVFPSGETEDGAPAVGLMAFVEPSMSCKKNVIKWVTAKHNQLRYSEEGVVLIQSGFLMQPVS